MSLSFLTPRSYTPLTEWHVQCFTYHKTKVVKHIEKGEGQKARERGDRSAETVSISLFLNEQFQYAEEEPNLDH